VSALIVGSLIVVMFLWGGSFIAIKIGLRYLTPLELVIARFVPSAIMLLPLGLWAAKRNRSVKVSFWASLSVKEKRLAVVASIFAVPAYHFCLNFGETLIPAGWASLVISLNPACIIIFASFLLHEKVGLRRWLGVGVALMGLIFIALTHHAHGVDGRNLTVIQKGFGIIVTLGAVISWGGFTTISKKLIAGREPLEVLGWMMTLGSLWTLPFWRPSLIGKIAESPPELWWSLVFLSVGCTVIGFVVWYWVLAQWSASKTGSFVYLVPLFALVISHLMLNEPLDVLTALGAGGVLGGVILAATSKSEIRHKQ